ESWPGTGDEPDGLPSDGPTELEAKADILSDQARRLAARGDALLARARDLKSRQNLRRRVGQMERDPFAPLEGSKRRTMASGTLATRESAPPTKVAPPPSGGGPTQSAPEPAINDTAVPTVAPVPAGPGGASPGPPPG